MLKCSEIPAQFQTVCFAFAFQSRGDVRDATEVLRGADAVARFFVRVMHEQRQARASSEIVTRWSTECREILFYEDGRLVVALSAAIESRRIRRIYALRNPEKLAAFENRNG